MPAKSRKQQRYLAAKFGGDWLERHHFDKVVPSAKKKAAPKKRAKK